MRDSVLVLGYHRVAKVRDDPYRLCVQPSFFAEQLEVLRHSTRVIDLETLRQGLLHGSLPRRAVAITFDDGYADAFHAARPLLEKYDLPATVFMVSGACGREFWWDRLRRLICSPPLLPENLELYVGIKVVRWSLFENGLPSIRKKRVSPRRRLQQALYSSLKTQPHQERTAVLDQLQKWVETASSPGPIEARGMTSAELQTLSDGGLIAIGAHTVFHEPLASLSTEAQKKQIALSKVALTNIVQKPVDFFSYPHGFASADTRQLVQQSGFQLACASHGGAVHKRCDPFDLPRFWLPDWNGEQFARWLHRWFR
ncbi:MAG TPA: polysaccharide deacetylase family protein [Acidobacteriota bacterium]|nr:polysaccharide deacetylase family protein [Acidobacteriota bacterium]